MEIPGPRYQNSAGRLLSICNAIPNNASALECISGFFDPSVVEDKTRTCISWLSQIYNLYDEFLDDMNNAPITDEQRRVLLSGLKGFRQTIYPDNLAAPFRKPTDAENSLLEMCAVSMQIEDVPAEDDIKRIRESIAALRGIVETGDISPQLRKVLLELVRLSEDAISRYNIHGARGLRKAFKAMLAEAAEAYAMASNAEKRDESNASIWKHIKHHLSIVDAVAAKVLKYKPLIETIAPLLLSGPH